VTTLALAGCFLTLATLSGFAAASGRRWALRVPLLAATPLLALAVWWQLSQRDGWPVGAHPPDGSEFVAGVVQAPAPHDPGAIYLWTQPPGTSTPRSYRLPYSPELERRVAEASHRARSGAHIAVRTGHRARRGHGTMQQNGQPSLQFFRLPPPGLEVKGRT
jgi:hypothetical protein